MNQKPPEADDKLDDTEAERRFNETLGRMLATPPKPHADQPKKGRGPKPAPATR